ERQHPHPHAQQRAAQKEGPARLAGKGGAKYLGCGKGEGSPNPPPTQSGSRGTVPMTAATKFVCAFSATIPTCCLKTAAIFAITGAHLHLDFVPGPCPASAGLSIFLPRFGGALYFFPTGQPWRALASGAHRQGAVQPGNSVRQYAIFVTPIP